MNKEEFIKALRILNSLYGKEMDVETLTAWYGFFRDKDINDFKQAINNHVRTSKYLPTVSEMLEEMAKLKMQDISSAEDEWVRVIDLVHKYGFYNQEKAFEEMNEYTRYVTKLIGFQRICNATSDEQIWNKKEFIEEYNTLHDKNIECLQLGNNTPLQIEEIL